MKLALDALGKDSVMYVGGEMVLPPEYDVHAARRPAPRLPDDAAERVILALDSATAPRTRSRRRCWRRRRSSIDVDHHHDNTRYGGINLIVADASSTGEIVRDLLAELGRRAHARDRRGALRRARHRHRPVPVLEHDAEGAPARGRADRRTASSARRSSSRIYESVPFERQKLMGKALDRARAVRGRPDDRDLSPARPTSRSSAWGRSTPRA